MYIVTFRRWTQGSSKVKEAENGGLQEQQPEDGPSSVISRAEEEDEASDMDKCES